MPRKGREFELLIKKLEECVLPTGVIIQSPGFIKDRITNQLREVDILIEHKIGTSNIRIIIECRDRKSVEDTTWIEQINTKVHDVRANKIIAVSSFDFSQPAKDKAAFYGIETRNYKEIDKKTIESWWKVDHIDLEQNQFTIVAVNFEFDDIKFLENYDSVKKTDEKFICRDEDNQLFSLNQLFQAISDKIADWESIKPGDSLVRKKVIANYSNPNSRYFINNNKTNNRGYIVKVHFVVDLQKISTQVPVSKILSYQSDNNPISHVIEFDGVSIGENNVLQIIKNQDGSISISARKNKNR